ncbi:formylglycine-generating enzyme family protein [candidate division KSB1 bacterium]
MFIRFILMAAVFLFSSDYSYSQWITVSEVDAVKIHTERGGPRLAIEYSLSPEDVSQDSPVYIFIRYSKDAGKTWRLLPSEYLSGDGYDIVKNPGEKSCVWWGSEESGFPDAESIQFKIRGIKMVKIPAGEFVMKSIPGGGYDESKSMNTLTNLPLYYMAKYETTIAMYTEYLNEVGGDGTGWNERMANELRCGIVQEDSAPDFTYKVAPGRENYPIAYVSWYDAAAFLKWCGLRLPTETEFEKAFRGGIYLDGDETKSIKNPIPGRKFPWGNEAPNEGGVYRCNYDGEDDGFAGTAPVGSYDKFNSPYGICDIAGNAAEWTLDWYSTSYHTGLDGFRMVRGGSWMAMSSGITAVTGATQLPLQERSIIGFRGVR